MGLSSKPQEIWLNHLSDRSSVLRIAGPNEAKDMVDLYRKHEDPKFQLINFEQLIPEAVHRGEALVVTHKKNQIVSFLTYDSRHNSITCIFTQEHKVMGTKSESGPLNPLFAVDLILFMFYLSKQRSYHFKIYTEDNAVIREPHSINLCTMLS